MRKVKDYPLNNDLAEIPKRGRTELKQIIIDGRKFRCNKAKEISNVSKKLRSIRNTKEYRSYALNKAKDAYTLGRAKVLLTRRAVRNKFRVNDVQSAF